MSDIPRLLLVDDDFGALKLLCAVIDNSGFHYVTAKNGIEALQSVQEQIPDLIILDWTMPIMDGWEVCRKLRNDENYRNIPIIMLTAKDTMEDEIIALEVGADDYMKKPFEQDILIARVKALLRRYSDEKSREIKSEEIYINLDKHIVEISGNPVDLWPKEFELLFFLMKKKDIAVNRDMLLDQIWGYKSLVTTRIVDATVKRLRSKLGDHSSRIQTIKGIGYKFSD